MAYKRRSPIPANEGGTGNDLTGVVTNGVVFYNGFTFDTQALGAATLNTGTNSLTVSGDASNTTVNIATGAAVKTLIMGSTNTTSITTVQSGTGGLNITSANGALAITSGTGALDIANDSTTQAVRIGVAAGSIAKTLTIGCIQTTSATNLQSGSGGIGLTTQTNGPISINPNGSGAVNISTVGALTGTISIGTGTGAQTINVGTGAAAKTTNLGSTNGASTTTVQSGTGGVLLSAAGNVRVTPVTGSAASNAITLNGRVGVATLTGQTTAAGATLTCTITNSSITAGQGVFCTVSNGGANDAQMTITRIQTAAGVLTVTLRNNGAAALNGNVVISFWAIN